MHGASGYGIRAAFYSQFCSSLGWDCFLDLFEHFWHWWPQPPKWLDAHHRLLSNLPHGLNVKIITQRRINDSLNVSSLDVWSCLWKIVNKECNLIQTNSSCPITPKFYRSHWSDLLAVDIFKSCKWWIGLSNERCSWQLLPIQGRGVVLNCSLWAIWSMWFHWVTS